MDSVRNSLNKIAGQYGVQVLDVRIKRTDLPDGAPLSSAFDRMRTAREQEARSIRAEGAKRAQIIRAQADAEAARTYAASFGKDPERRSSATGRRSLRRPPSFCRRKTTI
jgi:membrane protease subunit HflC